MVDNTPGVDKKGVLFAIFLGWCGGYRFYKKQYVLGILYLLTFGLFGIGWIVDICTSLFHKPSTSSVLCLTEVKRIHTKVVGVTFPSSLSSGDSRQEILDTMWRKDTLSVKYYEYEGKPAYMVILDRNNMDIGNLSAILSEEIYRKYKDCVIKIDNWELTGGDSKKYGCNIELVIYR